MKPEATLMRREILEIPDSVAVLLSEERSNIEAIAKELKESNAQFIVTLARGSSNHAATFFNYAAALLTGLPVTPIGPSITSIYQAPLKLNKSASLIISQSGSSPDIFNTAQAYTAQGSLSISISNSINSPLTGVCHQNINIRAGVEKSIAATKTYVNSVVAALAILAFWKNDKSLINALGALPEHLSRARDIKWPDLHNLMLHENFIHILGRGPTLAMSNEASLKFKETCQIYADSYSAAEFLHGPVSMVKPGSPVLALVARDQAESNTNQVTDLLAKRGAMVFSTSAHSGSSRLLDYARTGHPLTDPVSIIYSFYSFIEKLSIARGNNPDEHSFLEKATQTI